MHNTITVRYLKPTATKGSRLRAEAVPASITIDYPHGSDRRSRYWKAANALIEKLRSRNRGCGMSPWEGTWVEGDVRPGVVVFVLVEGSNSFTV